MLGLAGTAPGLVVEANGCPVVVLPGPPGELRRLWPRALESGPISRVLERTTAPERRVLRFYGASESAVAKALEEAGGDGDGVEVTICARDFEIHVDLLVEPDAGERAAALSRSLRAPLERYLFTEDEQTIQEIVLDLCRERGLTLGTAESCTGGMVAARLTDVPGSSDVFRGGVVAYADEVKESELGVPAAALAEHGAVSGEVASAMAHGVRDVSVSTSPYPSPAWPAPVAGRPRNPSASSSSMRSAPTVRNRSVSNCRATANGSACAPRWQRSTWCDEF